MNAPGSVTHGPVAAKPLPAEAYRRMTLVLRLGLGLALAILTVGFVAFVAMNSGLSWSAVVSTNPILNYLSFPGLASGLASGSIPAYLTLGLIVLVATPIVRVVSGCYYFEKAGEHAMTAITFTVLVLLLVGILLIGPYIR